MRIHVLRILAFLLVCVSAVPCWAQDKVTILLSSANKNVGGGVPQIARFATSCSRKGMHIRLEAYASARFMLLMASSISCVLLKPMVAQSTPAFWKANLIAFTRSS